MTHGTHAHTHMTHDTHTDMHKIKILAGIHKKFISCYRMAAMGSRLDKIVSYSQKYRGWLAKTPLKTWSVFLYLSDKYFFHII